MDDLRDGGRQGCTGALSVVLRTEMKVSESGDGLREETGGTYIDALHDFA